LNGFAKIEEVLNLEPKDIDADKKESGALNLTFVDAVRITYDLIVRGVLLPGHLKYVQQETGLDRIVKPILHPNQYCHLLKWLKKNGKLTAEEEKKAGEILKEEPFQGI
jgi:hypothetical protein